MLGLTTTTLTQHFRTFCVVLWKQVQSLNQQHQYGDDMSDLLARKLLSLGLTDTIVEYLEFDVDLVQDFATLLLRKANFPAAADYLEKFDKDADDRAQE